MSGLAVERRQGGRHGSRPRRPRDVRPVQGPWLAELDHAAAQDEGGRADTETTTAAQDGRVRKPQRARTRRHGRTGPAPPAEDGRQRGGADAGAQPPRPPVPATPQTPTEPQTPTPDQLRRLPACPSDAGAPHPPRTTVSTAPPAVPAGIGGRVQAIARLSPRGARGAPGNIASASTTSGCAQGAPSRARSFPRRPRRLVDARRAGAGPPPRPIPHVECRDERLADAGSPVNRSRRESRFSRLRRSASALAARLHLSAVPPAHARPPRGPCCGPTCRTGRGLSSRTSR